MQSTLISRMPASFAPQRTFFVLAIATCLVVAACSPGADYPSLFPAVHDIPPPRSDTRLDANQVQQATEDLISARDRLGAEAQGAQGKNSGGAAKPAAKSSAKPSAKSSKTSSNAAAGGATGSQETSAQLGGRQNPGMDAGQRGAETK